MTTNLNFNRSQKQQVWEQHIRTWEKSKLTQKAYCKSHKLSVSSFCYWRKKFSANSDQGNSVFYPLAIPASAHIFGKTDQPAIRISVSDQRFSVSVSEGFNPDHLKNVISTLEAI